MKCPCLLLTGTTSHTQSPALEGVTQQVRAIDVPHCRSRSWRQPVFLCCFLTSSKQESCQAAQGAGSNLLLLLLLLLMGDISSIRTSVWTTHMLRLDRQLPLQQIWWVETTFYLQSNVCFFLKNCQCRYCMSTFSNFYCSFVKVIFMEL